MLFAIAYSVAAVFSFLAIEIGSLSLTSLVIQYSLVIPAFYGLIALGGPIKLSMIIGIILLLISLALINIGGKKMKRKLLSSGHFLRFYHLLVMVLVL